MSLKNQPITKLIVPLAGWGTRFLPTSKNYPKEMAHLVDKPIIQHLVEEAYQSGIRDVIFITTHNKSAIAEYFSPYQHPRQEKTYRASLVARKNLEPLYRLFRDVHFHFIRRTETRGDGHSVLLAKSYIAPGEAFAVSMGDLLSPPGNPFLKQLIGVYKKTDCPVISVERVPLEDTAKLGVIAPKQSQGRLHLVSDLVEKPGPKYAPSNIAMTGKYILTPAIFPYLSRVVQASRADRTEPRLADALKLYAQQNPLRAYECKGVIHDTGNKFDFLKTTVRFGLNHPEFGPDFKKFIRSLQ